MKFVFTLLSLLFLPILSFKEIKPKRCINYKPFIEDDKFKKCSLLIKEQINDVVYSLINAFEKMNTEKYNKKCIFNEKEKEDKNNTHYTFKI
jgi:hypothetical protein